MLGIPQTLKKDVIRELLHGQAATVILQLRGQRLKQNVRADNCPREN